LVQHFVALDHCTPPSEISISGGRYAGTVFSLNLKNLNGILFDCEKDKKRGADSSLLGLLHLRVRLGPALLVLLLGVRGVATTVPAGNRETHLSLAQWFTPVPAATAFGRL
jgi:hypothetical protein